MPDAARESLAGKRLLLVEDEYIIAIDLALALEAEGAEIVGPASTVQAALDLIASAGDRLDGAVLDINLREQRVYPVADALAARGVPFVFTTGYDVTAMPDIYADVPRCEKPVDRAQLMRLLSTPRTA